MSNDFGPEKLVPRNNPHFEGHEAREQEFLASINSGRLHHAWLICGPRGIGKATLAYRMARYVLAATSKAPKSRSPGLFGNDFSESEPLWGSLYLEPEHPVFRRIAAGGHSDFLAVERSVDEKAKKLRKEIIVGDVRSIGAFLAMTPGEGDWRVVIIDAADEMNGNAANALLKVLEEPPKQALILLVAHNPGRVLPTIRSRCRRLALGALGTQTICSLLARYAPEIPRDEVQQLAELADGSIGEALKYAEDGGLEIYRAASELLQHLPNVDMPALHKLGDKMARDNTGEGFKTLGVILSRWLASAAKTAVSSGGTASRWAEVWEDTNSLFRKAESVNLDRKQVTLNAFLAIRAAVQTE